MVWSIFAWNGLGLLVKQNGPPTGNDSAELPEDHLQPFMFFMNPNNDGAFMGDNAPCLPARTVRDLFEEQSGYF